MFDIYYNCYKNISVPGLIPDKGTNETLKNVDEEPEINRIRPPCWNFTGSSIEPGYGGSTDIGP